MLGFHGALAADDAVEMFYPKVVDDEIHHHRLSHPELRDRLDLNSGDREMQAVGGDATTERSQHAPSVELYGELVAANDLELPGIRHPWLPHRTRHALRLCV